MMTARPIRIAATAAVALTLAACAGAADDADDVAADASSATEETSSDMTMSDDDMDEMSDDDMGSMSDDEMQMSDDDMGSMSDDEMQMSDDDMDDMDMSDMEMGSADGPRADEADAATLRQADFRVLDGAPEEFADASGTAYLALDPMTWVTADVEGLAPGTEIVGHLHAESCETSGGPHFKFDEDGGDVPPNEVHVSWTADDEGALTVSVTNEQVASDAMALVLHATDGDTTKALCADLAG